MPDATVTATVLGRIIVQAGRVLDVPFAAALDRAGLTRNAWWLLSELYRSRAEDVATIGEHARLAGLAGSSATIAAEQLTGRHLVRRWRTPQNRRITFVTITSTGTDLVEAVREDLEKAVAGLYDIYDAGERESLHDLLVRIVQAGGAGLLIPSSADLSRT